VEERIVSVQFGSWKFDGERPAADYLKQLENVLAPYGADSGNSYSGTGIHILYRALHTTKESSRETQPHSVPSGRVFTWDGRLDNREELVRRLGDPVSSRSDDVSIVAAAYEQWGRGVFVKLIGDWALSIWDPNDRSLVLAKDPIGTRHLYYTNEKGWFTWSTILDPLVLFAGHVFSLEEEYLAGWLSFFPAVHLTPYVGIHSVGPSSYLVVRDRGVTVNTYWNFDPSNEIRYRTDRDYEEHFRTVFQEAVRRRLRSNTPVLAELSGGMDSSSIVCMADTIIARGEAETHQLDTLSYYNDSEPNWNERPYFTKVEAKRGRAGCHIDVGSGEVFRFEFEPDRFAATPDAAGHGFGAGQQFRACLTSHGNRVVLSGIGGDEVTGGVPTPIPELQDLLARARFRTLAKQLKVWAFEKRKPWFHLLFDAARGFLPSGLAGIPIHKRPAPWLDPGFVQRHREALAGYESRLKVLGALPSLQENESTLDALRRQLACEALPSEPSYEKRYPYLDRNLLEFLYAIPREQLVRPGERRSLLRRALRGIVPEEILNRRRKAYVTRAPMAAISGEWPSLVAMSEHLRLSSLGIVSREHLVEALRKGREGREIPIVQLLRTFQVERWLTSLKDSRVIAEPVPPNMGDLALQPAQDALRKGLPSQELS
jgi:asparagine synthase (glutamine-hydrolysing)